MSSSDEVLTEEPRSTLFKINIDVGGSADNPDITAANGQGIMIDNYPTIDNGTFP
jgi:hypothetical protein